MLDGLASELAALPEPELAVFVVLVCPVPTAALVVFVSDSGFPDFVALLAEAFGAAEEVLAEVAGTDEEAAGVDCAATDPADTDNRNNHKYTTCQYRIIDPLVLAGRIDRKTLDRAPSNSPRANSNQ
jgi:hypothetical protein